LPQMCVLICAIIVVYNLKKSGHSSQTLRRHQSIEVIAETNKNFRSATRTTLVLMAVFLLMECPLALYTIQCETLLYIDVSAYCNVAAYWVKLLPCFDIFSDFLIICVGNKKFQTKLVALLCRRRYKSSHTKGYFPATISIKMSSTLK